MCSSRDIRSVSGELDALQGLSVTHIVSYYPPDRVGGVGEHVRVIHEGHLELGINSKVLTSGRTHSDPKVVRAGRTPLGFLFKSWRLARYARSCDVVHAHHGEGLLLLLLLRLRRNRPRILVMFHVDVRRRDSASRAHVFAGRRYGPAGWAFLKNRLAGSVKATVEWLVWLLADSVVVETKAVRQELSNLRPRREVTVVSHGLGETPEVADSVPEHVELLFVGTPGLRKRTHLLPRILNDVREAIPEARLRIVGFDVNGDPYLRDEAVRLGVLSAIEFVGSVDSEEVIPYYRSASVLVLPSAYEGLPMVLLEAMREGLVPVATAVSGHPEAIDDGENGYLVELDDVRTMAERCVRLLQDPVALDRMSERARQTLTSRFALVDELHAYVHRYRELSATNT